MAERTKEYLKGKFEDGDVPTGADFADLIDTMLTAAQGDAKYVAPSALSWVKNLGDFDTEAAGDAATLAAIRIDNNTRVRLMLYRFKGPTPSGIQMYHSRVVLNAFYATTYSGGNTARFDVVQYKFGTDSEGVQSRYVQQANSTSPVVTKAWHRITLNASELSAVGGYSVVNGVMNMGHFNNLDAALTAAARSDISGARGVGVLCFTYQGAAGKCSAFIHQTVKGDDVAVQYIFDRGAVKVRCVTGATGGTNGTAVVKDEATWAHRIAWNGNDIQLKGYAPYGGSAPVLSTVSGVAKTSQLPTAATASKAGLMSASQYSKLTALPTNDELAAQIDAAETAVFDSLWTSAGGTIDRSGHASAPYQINGVYMNEANARRTYPLLPLITRWIRAFTVITYGGSTTVYGGFDYTTGKFTAYNTLTDITPEQAVKILDCGLGGRNLNKDSRYCFFDIRDVRTLPPLTAYTEINSTYLFDESLFEVLGFAEQTWVSVGITLLNGNGTFRLCTKLKKIVGVVNVSSITEPMNNTFDGSTLLESVSIYRLATSISFASCPLISLASLQYLVTNASSSIPASAPITVTVHADVYAKLTDTAQTDWHAVLTAAAAKNIAFASA